MKKIRELLNSKDIENKKLEIKLYNRLDRGNKSKIDLIIDYILATYESYGILPMEDMDLFLMSKDINGFKL